MKHDETISIEQVIATALTERAKQSLAIPKTASISVDAFAQAVTRLNARVNGGIDEPRWFDLHTAAGSVRVYANARVPYGEFELVQLASFNLGDVVKLKTGGPAMTVEHVGERAHFGRPKPAGLASVAALMEREFADVFGGPRVVWCCWFVQTSGPAWTGPFRDRFDVDSLELVKP